jgi:hypothetical protein
MEFARALRDLQPIVTMNITSIMLVKSVHFAVATHITGIATAETGETLCGSVDWR